jgi:hypothetical protein
MSANYNAVRFLSLGADSFLGFAFKLSALSALVWFGFSVVSTIAAV